MTDRIDLAPIGDFCDVTTSAGRHIRILSARNQEVDPSRDREGAFASEGALPRVSS